MAETRYGYDAHQSNNSGVGQVGKDEVLIITITYWVDLDKARELQKQAIAENSKKPDKDKNKDLAVEEAWFSEDDYQKIAQNQRHGASYDVCIYAQKGEGYFGYCYQYDKPCKPIVEVNRRKSNCSSVNKDLLHALVCYLDKRWGYSFCVTPPIKHDINF